MKNKILIGFWILSAGLIVPVHAAVIGAGSCSDYDVQAAIDNASDGDTVKVPAGTCTWTRSVLADLSTNPKSLILQGAGIDQTIIFDALPMTDPNQGRPRALTILTSFGKNFRLTGFTFKSDPNITGVNYGGLVSLSGNSQAFRVDHNKIITTGANARAIVVSGYMFGVIDHNTINYGNQGIETDMNAWGGHSWGDGSWAAPISLGSNQAIYIEDNAITGTVPGSAVTDGIGGTRFVVRSNSITQGFIGNHGTDSSGRDRSTFSYEVYGNTFTYTSYGFVALEARGGTGVLFNNTIIGDLPHLMRLKNYRAIDGTGYGGFACDGLDPYDLNDPTLYASGDATLATDVSDRNLTTTGMNWTPNQWLGYSIINTTRNWGTQIVSNDANSIVGWPTAATVKSAANGGWSTGDHFEIRRASACAEQVGRSGPSTLLSGDVNPQPVGWSNEAIEPFYDWNNTLNGAPADTVAYVFSEGYTTQLNRDYFVGVARPGYTPYTYPHPLIGQFVSNPAISPSVSLTAPTANANVSGTIPLMATAFAGSAALNTVAFLIDGNPAGPVLTNSPYSSFWNTFSVTNGTHSVSAVATDVSGNIGISASVIVTVNNTSVPGLAGYWSMDEGIGPIAYDYSGHGHPATIFNSPTWATGKIGAALNFNGSNQYLRVATVDLTQTKSLSVVFWLNAPLIDDGHGHNFFDSGFNMTSPGFSASFNDGYCSPRQIRVSENGNGSGAYNIKCYDAPASNSGWHQYVFVFDNTQDGNNEVNLYVDGSTQAMTAHPFSTVNTNNFYKTGFNFMSLSNGGGGFSAGTLDDARVYSFALSAAQVQNIYSSTNTFTNTLTVTKSGSGVGTVTSYPGGINCGLLCSAPFLAGTVVTLYASPAAGSVFSGWAGDCSGSGSCSINLNSNASVTAVFTSGGLSSGSSDQFLPFSNIINLSKKQVMNILYKADTASTQVSIYDRRGNKVRDLGNANSSSASWDGRDELENPVASGIYTIILKSNGTLVKKKIVVVK